MQALGAERAVGFDIESKLTFSRNEVSQGPHLVQFCLPGQTDIERQFAGRQIALFEQRIENRDEALKAWGQ